MCCGLASVYGRDLEIQVQIEPLEINSNIAVKRSEKDATLLPILVSASTVEAYIKRKMPCWRPNYMDFPKRTKQRRSEAHSYAILLYKLRDLGIFRNLTDNDYGIDFELELVNDDQVTARSVKIQVKSAENLKLRANGSPSIGGIKQTTLAYWCELSYRSNIIAYAVDLATETIYVSKNLFWQATEALDGGSATKTIKFAAVNEDADLTAKVATKLWAIAPTAADHVYAHTLALRRLPDFLELLSDAFHYDPGTEVNESVFIDLLEASRILLWFEGDGLWQDENDRKFWRSYEYWRQKSEADNWDGLVSFTARPILLVLIPALLKALLRFRKRVIKGKYYWSHRNPAFLGLVYETELPDEFGKDDLIQWSSHEDRGVRNNSRTRQFVQQARTLAKKVTSKKKLNKN